MPRIHQDLRSKLNSLLAAAPGDVAGIAQDIVGAITAATGAPAPEDVPAYGGSFAACINEVRTCVTNDDLTGARLLLLGLPDKDAPPAPAEAAEPAPKRKRRRRSAADE